MKFFDLKCVNMKAYRAVVILTVIGGIILLTTTFVWLMARYGEGAVILPLIPVFFVIVFIKRFFRRDYRVGVSEQEVVLFIKGADVPVVRIRPGDIALIRHHVNIADDYLRIFRRGETAPAIKIATFNQSTQVHDLLAEISRHVELVHTTAKDGWSEYIAKAAAQSAPQHVEDLRRQQYQKPKRQMALIFAIVFLLLGVVPFVLIGIFKSGAGEGYLREDGRITYNGVPIEIDLEQIERLGVGSIVKDSTRVYFNGELMAWADAATFEEIGNTFFRDRNGLYQEKRGLFTRDKLEPLTGDFDSETLTGVDNVFYKDKDHVYYFNFNLLSGKNPLKRVEIEGIDAATFEAVGHHLWYRDAHAVYFGGWADLRRTDIDARTFEVLTWQVAKDKNHVYYLTRYLTQNDNRTGSERDNYAVLKGAHAPSFRMIDQRTFEDKNTTWTIGDEQAEPVTNRRGDVE